MKVAGDESQVATWIDQRIVVVVLDVEEVQEEACVPLREMLSKYR